ncbi:alcohol dehydrogenase catalytic domain-containing protein [Embleya hyalina]|uniref:alcohol dehydrogenase catalytic domain-containing protein n=1 Tax=Embleya hyalina TaxID=516124 RepID=UPI000F82B0E4
MSKSSSRMCDRARWPGRGCIGSCHRWPHHRTETISNSEQGDSYSHSRRPTGATSRARRRPGPHDRERRRPGRRQDSGRRDPRRHAAPPMVLGWDVAGVVLDPGTASQQLQVGDRVFAMVPQSATGRGRT